MQSAANRWRAMRRWMTALVFLACFLSPLAAFAFANQTDSLAAVGVSQPIPVDGKIAGSLWESGAAAKDFVNFTTRKPAGSDVATTVYILHDASFLYVGFVCNQTSAPITASQTTNGVGEELDDQVEMNIDTSGNGSRIYTFKTTPRGVRYQDSSESSRFNPSWQAVASKQQGGWSAEMVIPLQALRSSAGTRYWRINFQRRIAVSDESFSWAYNPHMSSPDESQYWPTLTGIHIAGALTRPPPHAEVYGLASLGSDRNQFQQTDGSFAFQKARYFGADLTYPITDTLSLVATGNPDFSNVEVDQQTIAPQQFQRSLTEYRPFFAQGSDYLIPGAHFNSGGSKDEVFYSPSIGTFNWGTQIEGTVGSNAVGILDASGPGFSDQAFGFDHTSSSQDFRLFADGVFAHHTQDGSSVTPCLGSLLTCHDDTLEFGVHKEILASGWMTDLSYAEESGDFVADLGLGQNVQATIGRHRESSDIFFSYHDIGPYYAPVDGFTLLSDLRGPAFFSDFNGVGALAGPIKTYSGFFGAERSLDRSGQVAYAYVIADLTVNLRNLLSFDLGPSISEQRTSNGYPDYSDSQRLPYNQTHATVSYAQDSASPVSVSYSWGPFATQCSVPASLTSPNPLFCGPYPNLYANFYLQQFTSAVAHQFNTRFNISAEFDGTDERAFLGPSDGQWLRRVSLGESLGPNANVALGLRSISGTGGFAEPGLNVAASFHDRFPTGNELFVSFGSPASAITLKRVIVKYILHLGRGGTGT